MEKNQDKTKLKGAAGKDGSFFDDCPICQAMKKAQERGRDLNEKELREVFTMAKENGAVVGGDWFDKKAGKA